MGKCCIQMTRVTSSQIIWAAAGELLREAKDLGCDIACMPENFHNRPARRRQLEVAEPDREGPVQSF